VYSPSGESNEELIRNFGQQKQANHKYALRRKLTESLTHLLPWEELYYVAAYFIYHKLA
jgi:hypothetical protein